jgi:rRNA maturation endonuclease Nob1
MKTTCNQCEVLYINGIKCHEHGCPEAYKDEKRICKWCGSEFTPEDKNQQFCSEECALDYYN